MADQSPNPTRYAIVGTGSRAGMYVRALATGFPETARLVALADVNRTRMDVHNATLTSLGVPAVPTYHADDVGKMLDAEGVDALVVTSVDRTHADYIVAALEAGRDAVTEKPMTTDEEGCRRIIEAQRRTGRQVTVTFNYRYNPVHERVRELLAGGAVGELGSAHFEWLLDLRHGADYFRRWHRQKANSGGLMVHKSSHHFDLVNWWLGATPEVVFGLGRLAFYGAGNGRRYGLARDYERAHGAPAAEGDPFAIPLTGRLKDLYLDAEHEDGYHRDQNVFGEGITIEDDMAVTVGYDTGATLSYHLTAYSPWEGYRLAVNGSRGRLELEVAENNFVTRDAATTGPVHRGKIGAGARLVLRPHWEPPQEIELPPTSGDHGGGDARMLAEIFGGPTPPDPLGRHCSQHDGALALLTGLAANRSFATGQAVRIADLQAVG